MVGGYLLYKYSLPPNIDPYGTSFLFDGITDEQKDNHNRYLKKNKLGFRLLFIGFILQAPFNFVTCFCEVIES